MPRASFLAAVWLALGGCRQISTLSIFPDAGPDDLVIAVVANGDGDLDVSWLRASDDPPRFTGDGDDRFSFFLIRDGDLNLKGRDAFSIYEAGERPEGFGACGRCLAPSRAAPQTIHSGDECPIPTFAEYSGDPSERTALEKQLRIGFDGACECQPFREEPAGALPAFELVARGEDAWPYETAAATSSGSVALFSEHRALLIRADGERLLREQSELPFRGRTIAAAATERDTFFVVGFEEEARKVYVLDAELSALPMLDLNLVPEGLIAFREGPVLITGEEPGPLPQAILCQPQPPFDCRSLLNLDGYAELGRTLVDAVRMEDGTLVISSEKGLVLIDHLPLGDEPYGLRLLMQPTGKIGYIRAVGRAGRHLVMCVQTEVATLMAAPIDRSLITNGATPTFTILGEGTQCRPFSAVIGRDDAVRMVFGQGGAMVIADGGTAAVVTESRPAYGPEGVDVIVQGMSTSEAGATLAWNGFDGRDVVWLRDGALHRLVYGRPDPLRSPILDLVATDDRVIALHASGAADLLFEEGDLTQVQIQGFTGIITHGAFDSERGLLLVAGTDGPRAFLGRTLPQGGAISVIDAVPEGVASFRRVKEMAPGVFLLITDDRIFVMSEDRLVEVAPTWDDMTTPDVTEAVVDGCVRYRDAAARDGRGYVVGCGGLLLEVDSDPPRARRIATMRGSQTLYAADQPAPVFTAVAALCSDDAVFAAGGEIKTDQERGRTWHLAPLGPSQDCADPFGDRCLLDADRMERVGSRYSSGTPFALAGDADLILSVFGAGAHGGGSVQRIGTEGRYRFPESIEYVVRAPWGDFVLASSSFGHILRGRISR